MTIALMEKLREYGWFLTEQGFESVSDYGNITDIQKIMKRASEHDLKEIGSGDGDMTQGDIVLQIQKLRNVAAPKHNEESRGAPRMLKLSMTDGKNNFQAIEIENISSVSLNTPPGTKIVLRGGTVPLSHGVILLKPFNVAHVYAGKVASLVEKWELNKKLASHSRLRPVEEGGPPPWIPFGKKIIKVTEQGKNFKALAEKEKTTEENAEFEAQRKNAIAEAAKQGSKKVFGGGNKQLLDHSVQRIVDQGFTIEQAEHALKINRNNVDRALKSLQKNDNKSNSNNREGGREPREPKGKRGEKKSEEVSGKPSSGKISLFDFLEDKLPAQVETTETSNSHHRDSYGKDNKFDSYSSDRYHQRSNEYTQSGRGGRNSRGNRGYQVPPRHQDENRTNKFSSNAMGSQQYNQYGGMNSQKSKPPRFQRNQEVQNMNQGYATNSYPPEPIGSFTKFPQVNEFRNTLPSIPPFPQHQEAVTPRDFPISTFKQNHQDYQANIQQDYQSKMISNSRNPSSYDFNHLRHGQLPEPDYRLYQSNTVDRNFKVNPQQQQQPTDRFYGATDNNLGFQGIGGGLAAQKSNSYYNNSNNKSDESLGGTWVWRVGDRCMAKYWEDNMYYNAEVTAVSKTTCVVQFKEFNNYEEVLQVDCIPITDDDPPLHFFGQENSRRGDHRQSNRPPRFEQNQISSNNMEYRRGGGIGSSAGGSKNGSYRKRNQQRSAQPIYQPPAQRGGGGGAGSPFT